MSTSKPVRKTNLLNFGHEALKQYFVDMGEKPFRATQIIKWLHQLMVDDVDQMSNISKPLRTRLKEETE
nr:bifunctional tRNA (adenosine(37)-C2)-methyltransferase TrmG/ribosomal RNA large subunit methyltransferase RlmN [Thiolinea sp.]